MTAPNRIDGAAEEPRDLLCEHYPDKDIVFCRFHIVEPKLILSMMNNIELITT